MSPVSNDGPAPWWESAFGALYPTVYAHRDDASATREAVFAIHATGSVRGACALEIGCGGGRHARALAAAGLRVVGVDRSSSLLAHAVRAASGPSYVRADFRALPFDAAFDCAFSFFTSFGYFDDEGNVAQLRSVRSTLRRPGVFFLDFLNAPQVVASVVAATERVCAGLRIVERRAVRGGRVEKEVFAFDGDRLAGTWSESVRLYGRDEVRRMLEEAGFAETASFGDLGGAPWSEGAPRLVIVAETR